MEHPRFDHIQPAVAVHESIIGPTARDPADDQVVVAEVDLLFERTGVYDWRVVDVVMPLEAK
jgi:hypothetical protein